MKSFIELWKATDKWHKLSPSHRKEYAAHMIRALDDLKAQGVIIKSWGVNTENSPHKADFDFYAVSMFPTPDSLAHFQALLESANWYAYFDQVNISGDDLCVEAVIDKMIAL